MNNPLVSIIIPTYNRAHLIGETLDSISQQTHTNWECIIVDDGSTDNSEFVISKYIALDSRFQYHHRPSDRPKGGNAARNYGFELSKGEYINWFDDDDIMLADFLQIKISNFTLDVNLVICSGNYVDDLLQHKSQIKLNENSNLFKEYVLWRLQILTPSILFRKSFLENKNLFSLNISRGQEAELFSRLFFKLPKKSYKIINSPLFLYRQHNETISTKHNYYVKTFKESQTIIAIENFKKSILLQDSELIFSFYLIIIDLFYRGLENKHIENCIFILKRATPQFFVLNKNLAMKFYISSWFLIKMNRSSYRIEKHFKNSSLL